MADAEKTEGEADVYWCDWSWDDPLGEAYDILKDSRAHIDALLLEVERGNWPTLESA
jgi:hypothetical protein